MSTGDLGLDYQLAIWEEEGLRAWFREMCPEKARVAKCPAAQGEWYMDKNGDIRCKLCEQMA